MKMCPNQTSTDKYNLFHNKYLFVSIYKIIYFIVMKVEFTFQRLNSYQEKKIS